MSAAPRLLLGFDYGTKQIGVAVGQAITGQARELCVLKAQNGVPDWQKVEALIKEWQPDAIVVGLPLNMDGTKSEMSERAEKFARRLNGRFNLPVHTHDERLTTFEAKGQRLDLLPVRHTVLRLEHAQLAGLAGDGLADGDADLLGAVVEAQQQAWRGAHAWPAWAVSRLRLIPKRAAAADRRWSKGVSKRMALSAGQVSQAFSASSVSSWPASQPA